MIVGLREQERVIYVCTNGVFMRKKMREYMAAHWSPEMDAKLKQLEAKQLVTPKEAEAIRNADEAARKKVTISPTKWMYWNVHVDGLEYTHDLIVEREGVFKECIAAIKMAKVLGYQVATNTTVYKETDVQELEDMFKYLSYLNVDGHTISPGYDYDAAKQDMVRRLAKRSEDFFLTRAMTREKFAKIQEWGERFTIFGTPVYQEFLAGKRELTCTAWAIPTRNIKGWKAPCYLMTDGHYPGYQEMLDKVAGEINAVGAQALAVPTDALGCAVVGTLAITPGVITANPASTPSSQPGSGRRWIGRRTTAPDASAAVIRAAIEPSRWGRG